MYIYVTIATEEQITESKHFSSLFLQQKCNKMKALSDILPQYIEKKKLMTAGDIFHKFFVRQNMFIKITPDM